MNMHNDVWLMEQEHVDAWEAQVELYEGRSAEFAAAPNDARQAAFTRVDISGSIATVIMHGPMLTTISPVMKFFGVTAVDMRETGEALLALDEQGFDLIQLDINSPGGLSNGTEALANIVSNLKTPVATQVGGMMASAALWIGLSAGTVEATANTAMIGSIGVLSVITDSSKQAAKDGIERIAVRTSELKGGPVAGTEVTDAQIAEVKRTNDQLFSEFKSAVASFRGLSTEQIDAAATGQVFIASDALELGLIDTITAGSVSAPTQEEFAMDAKTTASLCADYPDFNAEIQAHLEAGTEESVIRAELNVKNLEAQLEAETARADDATKDLSDAQEQVATIKAKDDRIEQLEAEVAKFGTFEEQNEDPGVGAQASANSDEEQEGPDLSAMSPSEKADHFDAIAKAEEANK